MAFCLLISPGFMASAWPPIFSGLLASAIGLLARIDFSSDPWPAALGLLPIPMVFPLILALLAPAPGFWLPISLKILAFNRCQ